MTKLQLETLVSDIVTKALAAQGVVKPAMQAQPSKFAAKDASILRTFKKRGIKDVVLMDRNDPTKPFNVRPFGKVAEDGSKSGWLGQGRIVKKGEKSVKGLFHISQTEVLPKAN